MSNTMLDQAVALNHSYGHSNTQGQAKLEVSGNITHERLKDLADIGIDYISTGAITKRLTALDFSLRVEK